MQKRKKEEVMAITLDIVVCLVASQESANQPLIHSLTNYVFLAFRGVYRLCLLIDLFLAFLFFAFLVRKVGMWWFILFLSLRQWGTSKTQNYCIILSKTNGVKKCHGLCITQRKSE